MPTFVLDGEPFFGEDRIDTLRCAGGWAKPGRCAVEWRGLNAGMNGLQHRLAAILAADAAGYSRLTAIDDKATVVALDVARAVFRTQIEAQQGLVIDMVGDSVLAVSGTRYTCIANEKGCP